MTYLQDGYHVARQVLPQSYLDTLEQAVFEPIALQAEHVLGRRFTIRDSLGARQALDRKSVV